MSNERDATGQGPASGEPAPGAGPAPSGASLSERQWASGAAASVAAGYFLPVIGPWAAPLALRYMHGAKQPASAFFDRHATEAINYGIAAAAVQLLAARSAVRSQR